MVAGTTKHKLYTDLDRMRPIQVEKGRPNHSSRSPFRRDYARLLHSPAFRRLQGKTQLYPGHESDFFRNRLTHSLEVAQIAKAIGLRLNSDTTYFQTHNIDLDLVEFAALAHDLGHPPFGHNGEAALDDCMKKWGGFEGNAQTLRILSVLEKKEQYPSVTKENNTPEAILADGTDNRAGLNLAYRSLAAVLKYDRPIPKFRSKRDRLVKGYYESERLVVKRIKEHVAPGLRKNAKFKTIECQIMDIADDIAYSTYDLEDGLKGGFLDPLMLVHALYADEDLADRVLKKVCDNRPNTTVEEIREALSDVLHFTEDGTPTEAPKLDALKCYHLSKLFSEDGYTRTGLTASIVDRFIAGVEVKGKVDPSSP